MTIVGWDISTSAIGVCVRDDDGRTREFGVIYPAGATHAEKHRSAAAQVTRFCKRVCPSATHYVEDRLGGFTGGLTTRQTLMALASMNAVISFVLSDFGTVVHIPPITAKRIVGLRVPKGGDKKIAVIGLVRSLEPSFPYAETAAGNYVRGTDDMADAWLNAEAGLRVSRGEAQIGQPKKAKGRGGTPRTRKAGGPEEGRVRVPMPRKARRKAVLERTTGQDPPVGQP